MEEGQEKIFQRLEYMEEKHEKALEQVDDKLKNLAFNSRKIITQISPFRCVDTKHKHRALSGPQTEERSLVVSGCRRSNG